MSSLVSHAVLDTECAIELAAANAQLNGLTQVRTRLLDIALHSLEALSPDCYDLIIAADLIYDAIHVPPLQRTLCTLLSGRKTGSALLEETVMDGNERSERVALVVLDADASRSDEAQQAVARFSEEAHQLSGIKLMHVPSVIMPPPTSSLSFRCRKTSSGNVVSSVFACEL